MGDRLASQLLCLRANFRSSRKEEIDLDKAQANAETAEGDASFAIDYAYAAIEEAEYAVLDAALARKEADELAASPSA